MRIYIDSNTFPATPGLYADAAKTKPIPRMIPAVELQRGGFEVAFVGSNQPTDIASVSLAASIEGAGVQVIAEQGEDVADDSGDAWRFDFALNAESLVAEIAKRGSARLRVGVIVEDDTERREWQFSTVVYPSASSEETDTEAVESAKNFAELAQRAATQATEAQESVAGNAQLAESAKQTAAQAANSAIEAADDAETAAETAQEAKTAAVDAKTAAQKAASDAQATLGNVYTKSQIDGVSTGAEVVLKMNEIIAQLKDYEEVTGETLPNEFWVEVFNALERWQKNPNEVKEWVTSKDANGNITSTNPYYAEAPTKPVVDFNVVSAIGVDRTNPSFNVSALVPIYISAKNGKNMLSSCSIGVFIAPNMTGGNSCFNSAKISKPVYVSSYVSGTYLFAYSKMDSFAVLKSASSLTSGFEGATISAGNIAKTLSFLPKWTDNKNHVVSFVSNTSGVRSIATTETITVEVDGQTYSYDNFPRFATDDANETLRYAVARATAKGWTVQFSAQ